MDRVQLYVVWDIKAKMAASPLMPIRNPDVAMRQFQETVTSEGGAQIRRYPDDFELRSFEAYLNMENGCIEAPAGTVELVDGKETARLRSETAVTARFALNDILSKEGR